MFKRGKVIPVGCAVLAAAVLLAAQVLSQEDTQKKADDGKQPAMAELGAQCSMMSVAGPEHEHLAEWVGTWKTESKIWMAPGADPMVSQGTAEFRLLLDGRYVEQTYRCDMGGQMFEGRGIDGYDQMKKKYVSMWIDNMSTGIYICEGTRDEKTKTTTYYGKIDDPMTGQKDKTVKSVAREINKNKAVFEMYDIAPDGKETKTMELTYTREK